MDAPKDILLTEVRLDKLAKYQREKRKYEKSNEDYWQTEIFKKRRPDNVTHA